MKIDELVKRLDEIDVKRLKTRLNAVELKEMLMIDINSAGKLVKEIRNKHKAYYRNHEIVFKNTYVFVKHLVEYLGYEITDKYIFLATTFFKDNQKSKDVDLLGQK